MNIPFGVSKIIPIPSQYLRDAAFSRAGESGYYSNFMVTLELRKHSVHPSNESEASSMGTVVRSWNFNLVQTKNLDINSSVLSEVDVELNIDPSYRYWYYMKWGKNGVWTAGIDLGVQTGIVRRHNSWSSEAFWFNGIHIMNKYYVYK